MANVIIDGSQNRYDANLVNHSAPGGNNGDAATGTDTYDLTGVVGQNPPPVEPDPQPPVTITFTLIVNHLDQDGNALSAPIVSAALAEGSAYSTAAGSFDGYVLTGTSGDAVSGIMNGNKAVTCIYKLDEIVEIPEEEVPLMEIPDEEVPLADVPKTGDNVTLFVILAALSGLSLAALALTGRKKNSSK